MRPNSIIIFMVYILTIFTGVNAIYAIPSIYRPMHHYRNTFEIIQPVKIELSSRILHDQHPFHIRNCPSSCLFGRREYLSPQDCAIICGFNYNIPH